MITLDNEFAISPNSHGGWELHRSIQTTDKQGNPKASVKTTFHANLEQVFDHVLEMRAGACQSVQELKTLLTGTQQWLVDMVSEVNYKAREALLENERLKRQVQEDK